MMNECGIVGQKFGGRVQAMLGLWRIVSKFYAEIGKKHVYVYVYVFILV